MQSNSEMSRLWTLEEVPALVGLWWLEAVLLEGAAERRRRAPLTRTAAERHHQEYGHPLRFGCCRG